MKIRYAKNSDAKALSKIIIESIKVNCIDDHLGEFSILDSWCKNKTPANISSWINNSNNITVVATEQSNNIIGVGMNSKDGQLLLLYVSPNYINKGIGRALLNKLEQDMLIIGMTELHLHSTATAHDFYKALGYVDSDKPIKNKENRVCYPMYKRL